MSKVSFIIVYVDDVAKSEAFYTSILGREAVESSPTFAMLPAAPGLMLGLWRRHGVKPPANAAGGGEIAFTAESDAEVDALCLAWRAKGAVIALEPTAMDFGYTFVAVGPDGERLRVFAPAAGDRSGG
jgi:catechol 2,3-dioxygenase-like lactoylglutathione lyase family enzyme